jgi:hypothetical protein
MWAKPDSAQPIWMGRVRPTPKREEKIYWVKIGPLFLGLSSTYLSGPAQLTCFNNIILYYIIYKKIKKIPKIL